jgi:hypothetical protein
MTEQFRLVTAANGVAYLTCPALGAPHGFSTRLGGVSAGPFSALNLGLSAGDDEQAVRENRRRWAAALELDGPIVSLHQVHGAEVHALDALPGEALKGDAVLTRAPELPVSVFTADCTPVLLHDPETGAVGAVHAGWRGTVARVVVEAVKAMAREYGARPETIRAAIGPAIGPCCFEVGHEVVAAARENAWPGWEHAIVPRTPRPHFDLFAANVAQLEWAGLDPARIFSSGLCTSCRADWFFSWRREGGKTGRLQAAIARPRTPRP